MEGTETTLRATDADLLAGKDIIIAMRFSFFGLSGWKSDFSKEKAQLFDQFRLETRLDLLERVALPSLAAQTDAGFHLFVLTSADLPDWAMARLGAACAAALGEGRYTIDARPPARARKFLRQFMAARYPGGRVVQVVLDDDDGLATDFTATLRGVLAGLDADPEMATRTAPYFVSFVNGYGLVFETDRMVAPQLFLHRYPYINLGLTIIGTPRGDNIFSIDHLGAPRKHGCKLVRGAPMYVRSVHGLNDSRVAVTDRWTPVADWRTDETVAARFGYLLSVPEA